jgi:hypothetical protein
LLNSFPCLPFLTSGLEPVDDEEGEGIVLRSAYPWEGTTRDYFYEEVRYLGFFPKSLRMQYRFET